ncbi:MAG TPA: hypothetical protein VLE53_00190 [Gemmatimonadaceae bacterium]|nr:hypothetical protein [Gemmatimonadaceae bacterium]
MSRERRLVLALLLFAAPLHAQESDTLVLAGDTVLKAGANHVQGFAAYPVTLLRALGGDFTNNAGRLQVTVLGSVLWFRPGQGTFTVNGMMVSLHELAFALEGELYLPRQFFAEWLPKRFSRQVRYDAATATLSTLERLTRATEEQPPPARDVAVASVAEPTSVATEELTPARVEPATPVRRDVVGGRAGVEMHVRVSGSYSDNFFQAPTDGTPVELVASTGEARLVVRTGRPGLNLHARVNRTLFDGFDPSETASGGLDWTAGRHHAEVVAGRQTHSPRLMAGDRAGFADIDHASGGYGVRLPGAVEVSVLGQYYDIYLEARDTESRYYGTGGSLRYRGFGYRFSPEVGGMRSRWDGPIATENYQEQTQWLALRMVPAAPLYLFARYRYESRSYTIEDPAAGNYLREDRRRHLTLSLDARITGRLVWGIYYTREDVVSTRTDRGFTSQALASGLSYRVW